MRGWRRLLRDSAFVVLALTAYFTIPVTAEVDRSAALRALISLLCIGMAATLVLWQVLRQVDDPGRRVDGLLLAMVGGVLIFALVFYRMELTDAEQFQGLNTRVDSLYFTMTTLLTVGFGDVNASGQAARVLVLIQMVFNIAVLATAASTLNNRVRENAARRAEARREALASGSAPHGRQARRTHRNPT